MGFFDFLSCGKDDVPEYLGTIPLNGFKPFFSANNVSYTGKSVTIPTSGSVHYYMKSVSGQVKEGTTLVVSGTVIGKADKFWNEGKETNNPSFGLILRQKKDNLRRQDYRFWFKDRIRFDQHGEGNFAFKIKVAPTKSWTNVYGKPASERVAGFRGLLKEIGWVGITFGGNGNYGHGLRADKPITVKLTKFAFV